MRRVLFVIAIFCVLNANAQNYLISFAGTGESTTVNTVEVENLTAGTSRTLNGDDILRLTTTTGVNSIENGQSSKMKIYPNPMTDKSRLLITPPDAGDAIISVYDITGKRLTQIKSHVENYTQEFTLSGLTTGLYFVNVKGNTYQFSGKLISNGKPNGKTSIVKVSDNIEVNEKVSKMEAKGVQATVDMEYTAGDMLKFTAISGAYSTIITDIPVADKAITFNFIACTDEDGNNYPVVVIGTGTKGSQVWMGENLKTSKYNDGTAIPNVTVDATWAALTTGAYCDYSNTVSNSITYGRLYNWYVAASTNPKKVCPTDWHVPTDAEWTTLTDYLGGASVSGGKLKEAGTAHWTAPNTGATNETGFTALPGGYRHSNGPFYIIGNNGFWWSSTDYSSDYAWSRRLNYSDGIVTVATYTKVNGNSVRCIKDGD